MNDDKYYLWAMIAIAVFAGGSFGFTGYKLGREAGNTETTTKLTHEAVREKAGTWTAGEQGQPEFRWSVCVPAKPQEVKPK